MSIMAKIFNMGNQQQQPAPGTTPAPSATPTPPGNIPPNDPNPGVNPAGNAPNGVVPPTEPQKQDENNQNNSPLDNFAKLWETPKQPEGKDPNQQSASNQLSPEKVKELASKVNFTNAISQEDIQAITQGGEGAVNAFMNAMNAVSQTVLAQTIMASNAMSDQKVKAALEEQSKQIPDLIRSHTINNTVSQSNPLYNHPAVSPITNMLTKQLAASYPEASAAEVSKMANDFIVNLAQTFNPTQNTPANGVGSNTPSETDWDKFLENG